VEQRPGWGVHVYIKMVDIFSFELI
jgi:hypothetical protein